jgi:hypothetical protein
VDELVASVTRQENDDMNAHFLGIILSFKRFSTTLDRKEGISLLQEIYTFVSEYAIPSSQPLNEKIGGNTMLATDPKQMVPNKDKAGKRKKLASEIRNNASANPSKRKKNKTCSFCKGNHYASSNLCRKKTAFQSNAVVYRSSNIADLETKIRTSALLGPPLVSNERFTKANEHIFRNPNNDRGAKHYIVHSVHPKTCNQTELYNLRYLFLVITAISPKGEILPQHKDKFICASIFFEKASRFDKIRCIFDQTGNCSEINGFQDRRNIAITRSQYQTYVPFGARLGVQPQYSWSQQSLNNFPMVQNSSFNFNNQVQQHQKDAYYDTENNFCKEPLNQQISGRQENHTQQVTTTNVDVGTSQVENDDSSFREITDDCE